MFLFQFPFLLVIIMHLNIINKPALAIDYLVFPVVHDKLICFLFDFDRFYPFTSLFTFIVKIVDGLCDFLFVLFLFHHGLIYLVK